MDYNRWRRRASRLNDGATTRLRRITPRATKVTKSTKSGLNISGSSADADVGLQADVGRSEDRRIASSPVRSGCL